ncbi:unnamed protein product [Ectocarpus sp. CCAP 1310/34]|nr:unnamed protein product [Ectocarpus sp. CCAP 1310/34]
MGDKFPGLKCGDPSIDKLVLCERAGCLLELFVLNQQRESRAPTKRRAKRGPKWTCAAEPVKQLKRWCFDCYCTLPAALEALLGVVSISGLSPDTNLDASSASFTDDFLAAHHGQQPDWVVTSPPYKGALAFVKAALTVAKKGVALKLPLSFLEPCADRAGWLQANPPALCMMMSRARYQPAHERVGEFWGVWLKV